jgi:hypothetical protein
MAGWIIQFLKKTLFYRKNLSRKDTTNTIKPYYII